MFIRWQSRKRKLYFSYWGTKGGDPYGDVHWNAVLVESQRIDGEPRQKHIANLCGFTEQQMKSSYQQVYVWERAIEVLNRFNNQITPKERRQFEAALAGRIGRRKPTKREIAATHKAAAASLKTAADKLRDAEDKLSALRK
jgi:hypothetical protein